MDKYNFLQQGELRPTAEQLLDTKLFYLNSVEIYSRFDEWKDNDDFYFIPLFLQMSYFCAGWTAEIAPDPVWLGSFVRCNLEHPELFQLKCPVCNKPRLPYRYVGSPLSGRVDLEYNCECGKKGSETVSGWRSRAIALRNQLASDKPRMLKNSLVHRGGGTASVEELLRWLRQ